MLFGGSYCLVLLVYFQHITSFGEGKIPLLTLCFQKVPGFGLLPVRWTESRHGICGVEAEKAAS
jgi:hypothetical protein